MKSIKGTETEKNLLKAFAGESEARNRYTYFAGVAKKAGYEQIAAIFLETADNEKEHAKVFFKLLKDACIEVTHAVCTAPLESTEDCLLAAAAGEHDEWSDMYPAFAEVGRVFAKEKEIQWKCRNCGYVHTGSTAPKVCPACAHPQAFFEELADNF